MYVGIDNLILAMKQDKKPASQMVLLIFVIYIVHDVCIYDNAICTSGAYGWSNS